MRLRLACIYCGAAFRPKHRRCPACGEPVAAALDSRFVQCRMLEVRDGIVAAAARDSREHRDVALHILLPTADPAAQKRLETEARLLHALAAHPGFPRLTYAGRIPATGAQYMATASEPGTPVAKALRHASTADVVEVFLKMLEPVAVLHSAGCVHSALSLECFTLTRTGVVILNQLGSVRSAGAPAAHSGVPGYQAPEQQNGLSPLTPAADVFALGVCLYQLLTKRYPYGGAKARLLLKPGYAPKPMSQRNLHVPFSLDDALMPALARNPADRPPSAQHLQDALRDAGLDAATEVDTLGCSFRWRVTEWALACADHIGSAVHSAAVASGTVSQGVVHAVQHARKTFYMLPPKNIAAAAAVCVTAAGLTALALLPPAASVPPSSAPATPAATSRSTEQAKPPARTLRRNPAARDVAGPGIVAPREVPPPSVPHTDIDALIQNALEAELTEFPLNSAAVQFLTWPPAEIYLNGQFIVEAPNPRAFTIPPGAYSVEVVANHGQIRSFCLDVEPGKSYQVKLNFDTEHPVVKEITP